MLKRCIQGVGLLLLVGILSSCMIHRLIQFKAQLNNVKKYVQFNVPGLLTFTKPILMPEDLHLITGVDPTEIVSKGDIQTHRYDFHRSEAPHHSLTYTLQFKAQQLTYIEYPMVLFNVVSLGFALQSLSAIGEAGLPTYGGAWELSDAMSGLAEKDQLKKDDITTMLGPPTTVERFPSVEYWVYVYAHPTHENKKQTVRVVFVVSNTQDRVREVTLILPRTQFKLVL
jgi:hypothetical protein